MADIVVGTGTSHGPLLDTPEADCALGFVSRARRGGASVGTTRR